MSARGTTSCPQCGFNQPHRHTANGWPVPVLDAQAHAIVENTLRAIEGEYAERTCECTVVLRELPFISHLGNCRHYVGCTCPAPATGSLTHWADCPARKSSVGR